jgi:hypothetical protein
MDGYGCNRSDGSEYGQEHDEDEPCGTVCGLGRGLGYPHGVDKGVRDEQDELHGLSITAWIQMVSGVVSGRVCTESEGWDPHLNRERLAGEVAGAYT